MNNFGVTTKIDEIKNSTDRNVKIEDLPEISLKVNQYKYILMHHYDIGDSSVHFSFEGLTAQEVKDLAVYIQFKAENLLDDTVSLHNITIVQFLEIHGANIIDECVLNKENFNPVGMILIDMYEERESRICGNNWYAEHYESFDSKYGEVASIFQKSKSNGKNWNGSLI